MAVAERPDIDEAEDARERVTVWDTGEVLYVHPVASLFPMMSGEELDDLAEDIKANGQAEAIVLDQHGQLIDGRNRLEACRRVEVSPDFVSVTLDDPVAYILTKNVTRRHLTKGQQAMSVARAAKFQIETMRRGTAAALSAKLGLHKARVSQAFTILEYAPEYADAVLFRGMPLVEALAKAQERKAAAQSDEAKLEVLKEEHPDLADLVIDERLTLAGALAERDERERKQREKEEKARAHRLATTKLIAGAVLALDPGTWTSGDRARALIDGFDAELLPEGTEITSARLRACAAVLERLIAGLDEAEAVCDGER
jgi:ParB-like chromosome segregation protein Spo0J